MIFDKYLDRKGNYFVLFLILLTGTVLRLFDILHVQFTYDEISALTRTQFDSLHELIEKGVKTDFHPLGIQVFLFYYTKVFGYNEIIVKLPFILAGIASIFLTWHIAKTWFNDHVALLSAAVIATVQYTVMYSQIARPYAIGMLLSLLLVHFFTRFFIEKEHTWKNTIFIGVIAALSGYNHHFNFLFSFIVLASGAFYLTRNSLKYYTAMGGITGLLYLPELPVTLFQMKTGGVGTWLGKPSSYFFTDYLGFIFHYSPLFYFVIAFAVVAGIIISWKSMNVEHRKRLLLLSWFMLPFFIGYYYSIFKNPVLQFSILIFGFPYFIIFLFSFWSTDVPVWIRNTFVGLIITVSVFTLIVNREYYSIFYRQNVETFYQEASQELVLHPDSTLVLSSYDYNTWYKHNEKHNFSYTAISDTMAPRAYTEMLKYSTASYLVIDGYNPLLVSLAKEVFPYVVKHRKSFLLDYHVLSKLPVNNDAEALPLYASTCSWDAQQTEWKFNADKAFTGEEGMALYALEKEEEWGPAFSKPLLELSHSASDIIEASAKVFSLGEDNHLTLVFEIKDKDSILYWSGRNLVDFSNEAMQWNTVSIAFQLNEIIDRRYLTPDTKLNIYLWNNNKQDFWIRDFTVRVKEGNEYVFSLFNPICK